VSFLELHASYTKRLGGSAQKQTNKGCGHNRVIHIGEWVPCGLRRQEAVGYSICAARHADAELSDLIKDKVTDLHFDLLVT
jgi:hypothetical protein